MTHPTIPELGPVTDREYLIHIGVLTDIAPLGMDPELIKAAIRMKGITPTELARSLGVSGACVSHVIYSRGVSARVEDAVAKLTGIPKEVLWPRLSRPVLRGRPVKARAAA